jgi:hypothetical protein
MSQQNRFFVSHDHALHKKIIPTISNNKANKKLNKVTGDTSKFYRGSTKPEMLDCIYVGVSQPGLESILTPSSDRSNLSLV